MVAGGAEHWGRHGRRGRRALGAAWSPGEASTGSGMVTRGGMWCPGVVAPGRSGARASWWLGAWGSDLVGVEVAEPGLVGDDRDLDPVGAVELREDLR